METRLVSPAVSLTAAPYEVWAPPPQIKSLGAITDGTGGLVPGTLARALDAYNRGYTVNLYQLETCKARVGARLVWAYLALVLAGLPKMVGQAYIVRTIHLDRSTTPPSVDGYGATIIYPTRDALKHLRHD